MLGHSQAARSARELDFGEHARNQVIDGGCDVTPSSCSRNGLVISISSAGWLGYRAVNAQHGAVPCQKPIIDSKPEAGSSDFQACAGEGGNETADLDLTRVRIAQRGLDRVKVARRAEALRRAPQPGVFAQAIQQRCLLMSGAAASSQREFALTIGQETVGQSLRLRVH
jgi:hypothetical protein